MYNNKYEILASTIAPNPTSVRYWADLSSNPNGGDLKYFNGKEWKPINDKSISDTSDIKKELMSEITRANTAEKELDNKIVSLIGNAPEILNSIPELIEVINANVALVSRLTLEVSLLKERIAALETSKTYVDNTESDI